MKLLQGMVARVVGVANGDSIAAGCAQAFSDAGAEVILTYHNERAKPYVLPVATSVGAR